MKKTTRSILDTFPMLEPYLLKEASSPFSAEDIVKLNDIEQTFLKLAWYFEAPSEHDFNLRDIYETLSDDWLAFALEKIMLFFRDDTYLLKEDKVSIVTDGDAYYNQTQFANYLNDNGEKFDRAKMSMYVKRGVIPEASLTVSGTKYWRVEVCEAFLKARQTDHE